MKTFLNHYECDHAGRAKATEPSYGWSDTWDCQCNDRCPVCNAENEPWYSEDVTILNY
jgi:hypothetical protein